MSRYPFFSTFLFLLLFTSIVFATTTIPHPFFFTENKGQWDNRVLYKCNARNGMTWFLERDGVTLLTCVEDKTQPALPVPGTADLPVCMQKHPARYPMKSHALKFHFLVVGQDSSCLGSAGVHACTPFDHPPSTIHYPPSTRFGTKRRAAGRARLAQQLLLGQRLHQMGTELPELYKHYLPRCMGWNRH